MNMWLSLCLLLLAILAGLATSKGTVRLYFAAQLIAALAQYLFRYSDYYMLIYICSTLLMVEMSVFLLWDAGVSKLHWRDAWTAAIWMTLLGGFGLMRLTLTEWYLLGEGLLFAAIGMAMLLLARKSQPLLAIGTLTWGMAIYDFLYIINPKVQATNWLAEPVMCSAAFLWLAAKQVRVRVTA